MTTVLRSLDEVEAMFRSEYDRLRHEVYPSLPQWPGVKFTVSIHRYASARYERKPWGIVLRPFTMGRTFATHAPDDELIDTIRHEVAHAVCFVTGHERAHHGPVWKRVAVACGARPEATKDVPSVPQHIRWLLRCPSCGQEWRRSRRPSGRQYHPSCGQVAGRLVVEAVGENGQRAETA